MKLYTDAVGAPNPKKVRVYCAEKGIDIPREVVDIINGQNRTPEQHQQQDAGHQHHG